MDNQPYSSDSEHDGARPHKRARTSPLTSSGGGGTPDSHALPPLSLSLLGVEPLDEFIREVADFVHHMIMTRPEGNGIVEVEAKIGVLKYKGGNQRLDLPVLVETILRGDAADYFFETNMSAMQHKHFNNLLNNLKTAASQPGQSGTPLQYTHLRLVDTFYPGETSRDEKIRVTRDEKSGQVLACVKKVRLGSLDIYSPKRATDWRISVNLEVPVPPPIGASTYARKKDRMSYTHEEFVVDLTQVTSSHGADRSPEVLHELEVELARPEYLLTIASKRGDPNASEMERNAFDELIRAFVNNSRILVRNSGGPVPT